MSNDLNTYRQIAMESVSDLREASTREDLALLLEYSLSVISMYADYLKLSLPESAVSEV